MADLSVQRSIIRLMFTLNIPTCTQIMLRAKHLIIMSIFNNNNSGEMHDEYYLSAVLLYLATKTWLPLECLPASIALRQTITVQSVQWSQRGWLARNPPKWMWNGVWGAQDHRGGKGGWSGGRPSGEQRKAGSSRPSGGDALEATKVGTSSTVRSQDSDIYFELRRMCDMRRSLPLIIYLCTSIVTRRMQHIVGRAWARQYGGCIRLLPPEINWAHRMLSQSSASSLLRWSCAHWLKRVASVLSDAPLSAATYEGGELSFN